jgi:riboflavin-specific deaminase-like protein
MDTRHRQDPRKTMNAKGHSMAEIRSQSDAPDDGRPFVLVNMCMSADGKISTFNDAISSMGSPRDMEHLFALRATVDAVMSGARTVNLHDVTLDPGADRFRRARVRRGLAEENLRVVVSGSGSLKPECRIFRKSSKPVVVLTTSQGAMRLRRRLPGDAAVIRPCGKTEVNLRAALRWLRQRFGVRRLLCEGGGELNDALFRADVVDELHLTVCPLVIGGRAAPTIAGGTGMQSLARARRFHLKSRRQAGDEMFLVYRRAVTFP